MVKKIYVLLTGIFLLTACDDPVLIQFLDKDLIFPRAVKIEVSPYTYTSGADTIMVMGESLFNIDSVCDTVTQNPVFAWEKTRAPFVVVAIFDQLPQISGNEKDIVNNEDIVWMWHSGLENDQAVSTKGRVLYGEGLEVNQVSGMLNEENFSQNPKPLPSNSVYYWGVWAWNRDGVEVNFSSYPLKIYVK